MTHVAYNGLSFGWWWILWFGFVIVAFSSAGNFGYTYRVHRKFDGAPRRDALAILNERYAGGDVTRAEYLELKADIASA